MSATPLTDAHVVSGPTPWIPAEAARGIEIQLRKEIAKLRAFIDDLEEAGRHSGARTKPELHSCDAWIRKGQVVYIGEEKP